MPSARRPSPVRNAYRRARSSAGRVVRRLSRPPVCDDVRAWAADHGIPIEELFAPRSITRRPPRTVESIVSHEYTDRLVANQRGRYLVAIPDARLVGRNGIVLLPDGKVATESSYGRATLEQDHEHHRAGRRSAVDCAGDYFSLVVRWSRAGNYYHWFHDTLTRLYGLAGRLPVGTRYVVPSNLGALQRETLEIFGLDAEHVVPFAGDEVWRFERLHFAPPVTNSGSDRRDADLWLRDRVLAHFDIVPRATGRRIFISRRRARARHLVNEEDVEACVRDFGFETCVAESLTFRDQVELFSRAEAVVSTHGAGFTNMLYAPAGLKVLDMIEPTKMHQAFIYWAMAEELEHEYWYLTAEPVAGSGRQSDTLVPISKLAASLAGMLGHGDGG